MNSTNANRKTYYIDAEKLCELAKNHINRSVDCNDIMRFPCADVQEVRHGQWELIGKNVSKCTVCGCVRNIKTQFGWNFCPVCGAKMGVY